MIVHMRRNIMMQNNGKPKSIQKKLAYYTCSEWDTH